MSSIECKYMINNQTSWYIKCDKMKRKSSGWKCLKALTGMRSRNTHNAESCDSLETSQTRKRGMKTSVLKMASSTLSLSLPLFLFPSFAPSVAVCLSCDRERGGGVAMVTCQEETVLQCKSRRRARALLSPPPPPPGPPLSHPLQRWGKQGGPRLFKRLSAKDSMGIDCF